MRRSVMVLLGIAVLILPQTLPAVGCGDVNSDETINILDIVYLINNIYKSGPDPNCGTEIGTMSDIDGNVYYTVKIGDQWWMAENLKVTHYRDGNSIPLVTDGSWDGLTVGAYCEYYNDADKAEAYGRLYNWYAVDDSRNIAPEGWHVPSDADWQILIDYLGGDAVAGGKLKEAGSVHWLSPNTGATNASGFMALPVGFRLALGLYLGITAETAFWSSTENNYSEAWSRDLTYNYEDVNHFNFPKSYGLSIRCVKD